MDNRTDTPVFRRVKSSNVKGLAYSENTLYVQYTSGHVYTYTDISPFEHEELFKASSVGRQLRLVIAGHPFQKLREHPMDVPYEEATGSGI